MKRWWEKYQAWNARRKHNALQKWSQERLEGKARFVLRNTLIMSMIYLTANEIVGGHVGPGTIVLWHVVGFVLALYQWASNETKYQLALNNGQLPAGPVSRR